MGNIDIAKSLYAAFESGDLGAAKGMIADDFTFSGPVPKPIGKEQWVGLQAAMTAAFPDWSFNASDYQEQGDVVRVAVQITGTHTNDLDLTPMGMPKVPATGKSVSNPVEHPEMTIKDGKITSLHVADVAPDGGVPGILKQLGVEMPPPPA